MDGACPQQGFRHLKQAANSRLAIITKGVIIGWCPDSGKGNGLERGDTLALWPSSSSHRTTSCGMSAARGTQGVAATSDAGSPSFGPTMRQPLHLDRPTIPKYGASAPPDRHTEGYRMPRSTRHSQPPTGETEASVPPSVRKAPIHKCAKAPDLRNRPGVWPPISPRHESTAAWVGSVVRGEAASADGLSAWVHNSR